MESAMEDLREREKYHLVENRRQRRADAINKTRRGLGHISSPKHSVNNTTEIASKLKAKHAIDVKDLLALMHSLSEHEENISSFFKVPGALQGLVRELTGTDAHKQLIAIGCICNLALGPPKSCYLLTKTCGTYLITYLQTQNKHILELCTWTLGNLCTSNKKTINTLEAQGYFDNIIPLLNNNIDENVVDSTAYALSHLLYSNPDAFKDCYIERITQQAISCYKRSDQIIWLIYLLSDKHAAQNIFIYNNFFKLVLSELIFLVQNFYPSDICIINCLVRIAANLVIYENENSDFIYNDEFIKLIKVLISSDYSDIVKDTLWLIGNIYNIYTNTEKKEILFIELSELLNTKLINS